MATNNISPDSAVGTNPLAIAETEGLLRNISMMKHAPIMQTSEMMNASILRMPKRWIASRRKTSAAVITTGQISEISCPLNSLTRS